MGNSLEEWVRRQEERHQHHVEILASLPWEEYVERAEELTAHIAKLQVLCQVRKKLQESK